MITEQDYITSSGKFPERANSPELTDEVKANIKILLKDVNAFLNELGVVKATVSSGFRPSAVNKGVGGAKKSGHLMGKAIDLVDLDATLDFKCRMNPKLMKKYNLMLEDPMNTPNWCHLDNIPRVDRESRMFKLA